MAVGWTWAMDTPFKWTKQVASYFGGTRNGMCISWPGHIKDAGGIRQQFHHVIDIVPTILEATTVAAPKLVDGIKQAPIEGVSLGYTFDAAHAGPPRNTRPSISRCSACGRSITTAGSPARSPTAPPWEGTKQPPDDVVNGMKWELFDLNKDWTESNNLAATHPDKLKELQNLFWVEAKKYQVLPLDASALTRFVTPRPSITAGREEFVYTRPLVGTPLATAPSILNKSFRITAEVDVPQGGAEGMLVTAGGRFGGWGFYVLKGRPVFVYDLLDFSAAAGRKPGHTGAGQAHRRTRFSIRRPGLRQRGQRLPQDRRQRSRARKIRAHDSVCASRARPSTSVPTPAAASTTKITSRPSASPASSRSSPSA